MHSAGQNLKDYADSHLDELKEDLAPVVERLPEPVQNFLDRGGWWGVLGFMLVLILFYIGLSNDIGRLTDGGFNTR